MDNGTNPSVVFSAARGSDDNPSPSDLGISDFVRRFYQQCLGREPDAAGWNGWVEALRSGAIAGDDLAFGFIFSSEFLNRNTSNEEFLQILYRAFFNRDPDVPGFNAWLNYIISHSSGESRRDVLEGFLGSQEFANFSSEFGISPRLEFYGIIQSRPQPGFQGNWVIGGQTYTTDAGTEFDQLEGPLAVGSCAKVHLRSGRVHEIDSEPLSDCQ